VDLLLWAQQAEDIDRLLHRQCSAATVLQHGMQQQLWAELHCQLLVGN